MRSRTKAGCQAEHSGFLSLPDEILAGILKLLPFQAKVHAEAICKRLNSILSSPLASDLVWDTINLCDVPVTDHRQFGRCISAPTCNGFARCWLKQHRRPSLQLPPCSGTRLRGY